VYLSRRHFMKGMGALSGVAAAGVPLGTLQAAAERASGESSGDAASGRRIVKSTCCHCVNFCGIDVEMEDDVIRTVGTDKARAPYFNVGVCPKGVASGFNTYNPYRVKAPLKRTNPNKGLDQDPRWVEIGWEEALDTIAGRLRDLRATDPNPLVWQHGHGKYLIGDKFPKAFCKAFGTANLVHRTTTCEAARHVADEITWGYHGFLPDLDHCRLLLNFGGNYFEGEQWSRWLDHATTRAKERGMKVVVVVEPRLSHCASNADEWIPVRPGKDVVLLLAMARVLIDEGLIDQEFLATYTNAPNLVGDDGRFPGRCRLCQVQRPGRLMARRSPLPPRGGVHARLPRRARCRRPGGMADHGAPREGADDAHAVERPAHGRRGGCPARRSRTRESDVARNTRPGARARSRPAAPFPRPSRLAGTGSEAARRAWTPVPRLPGGAAPRRRLEGQPMTIELRGVSTASLGGMPKGYGVMAGIGAAWPDARFWWTPEGALAAEIGELVDCEPATAHEAVHDRIFELARWARETGRAFEKVRRKTRKEKGPDGKERTVVLQEAGEPPLEDPATWSSLAEALALDAEGVGVSTGQIHRPSPVLASWGQDGSGNLFSVLREAGEQATRADIEGATFGGDAAPGKRLTKGSGVLFPEGIKRYATGAVWIHEKKKPLGLWELILAMRGLLLLRGAVRAPRGSRYAYPAFPFVFPGAVVRAQGSMVATQEVFLPTWSSDHPRTLAELQAQVRGFQARVGRRDFASGAADFRRAVAGRAVTGAFDAFHRFALEPRKPGKRSPQTQAIARGVTTVGPASAARGSLRLLLAPLDDSGWLETFRLRWTGGTVDEGSETLALAKTRFDEVVHAAIDTPDATSQVAVLEALWDLQLTLWRVSERPGSRVRFRPAPLLEGRAWGRVLWTLLRESPAARLGWALASLGWATVPDGTGQAIKRPVVEQLLPVLSDAQRGLRVPEPPPAQRVPQPGHNPARELAALFWRRWLDTASLPVLPTNGTRPADVADVAALLWGNVSVRDVQRRLLAFLMLDGSGDAPPPVSTNRPVAPAYAALRLWLELSARPAPGERRPLDGAVPRGIATGTARSVASACRTSLRRLRIAGLPGDWAEDARPSGKSVAQPGVRLTATQARLMATAVLVPVRSESVARLAGTLLVPSVSREPKHPIQKEIANA
jgi:CRISPR-associated protein Csx17